MHHVIKTCTLLIGGFGLVACTAPEEPFAFDTTYTSFADIDAALGDATDGLVFSEGDVIDTDMIAQSADFDAVPEGSVLYRGAVIAEQSDIDATLIGQLEVEVGLDTNTMDGRAGNFIDSEDGAYTGTLLGNSTFVRDVDVDLEENHFAMTLTGALFNAGNAYDASVALEGNFFNDGDFISHVAGDADVTLGGVGPAYEEGAFAAERK